MKKLRIYLDTSVIGGCFDPEFAQWSNGLMRDIRMGIFVPVLSQVVADEVNPAPSRVLEMYQELLTYGHEMVEVTDEVLQLTAAYTQHSILPENFLMTYFTSHSRLLQKLIFGELELQTHREV